MGPPNSLPRTSKQALLFALLFASSTPAEAHTAARGFVLLLPTTAIIIAGALAVLASFAALSLAPDRLFRAEAGSETVAWSLWPSLVAAAILVGLILAGFWGSHDPLENLLPLFVWTFWWVILVVAHAVFGNLWRLINPFTGLHALLSGRGQGPLPLSEPISGIIAVILFAAFAWWQLVSVTPQDPVQLAWLVSLYVLATLAASLAFGRVWFERADPFFQMFTWIGAAAPVGRAPGLGLLSLPPLTLAQMLLAIVILGTLSFDGLANSFLWASLIGINPLDFPGRGAVMGANTAGLFGFMASLAAIVAMCVALGWHLAGRPARFGAVAGPFVLSLIPIAIALHFAHFLTDALVNGQYLVSALFESLGLVHLHVSTGFLNTAWGVWTIYTAQALAVLLGHIVAVAVAHAAVLRLNLTRYQALRLELPMALLMVAYTGFSLWSLSTATIG